MSHLQKAMKEQYPSKARYGLFPWSRIHAGETSCCFLEEKSDFSLFRLIFHDTPSLIFLEELLPIYLLLFLGQNLSSLEFSYNCFYQTCCIDANGKYCLLLCLWVCLIRRAKIWPQYRFSLQWNGWWEPIVRKYMVVFVSLSCQR